MSNMSIKCLSTHGGAGYAPGSYWDGYDIVCGECGERIVNPIPTGSRIVYYGGFLGLFQKAREEPKWPSWLRGKRGVKWTG